MNVQRTPWKPDPRSAKYPFYRVYRQKSPLDRRWYGFTEFLTWSGETHIDGLHLSIQQPLKDGVDVPQDELPEPYCQD
jgi:hypothetical protein